MRKILIESIINTDMAFHQKNKVVLDTLSQQGFNDTIKDQLVPSLIHAFDIGNPILPKKNYFHQAYLLAQEFNQQTLLERENNVDVTPFFIY